MVSVSGEVWGEDKLFVEHSTYKICVDNISRGSRTGGKQKWLQRSCCTLDGSDTEEDHNKDRRKAGRFDLLGNSHVVCGGRLSVWSSGERTWWRRVWKKPPEGRVLESSPPTISNASESQREWRLGSIFVGHLSTKWLMDNYKIMQNLKNILQWNNLEILWYDKYRSYVFKFLTDTNLWIQEEQKFLRFSQIIIILYLYNPSLVYY